MASHPAADPNRSDHAELIVETMREPLLVLSPDLRVLRANRSFYRTFRTLPEQVEDRLLSELGEGQWARRAGPGTPGDGSQRRRCP